MYKNLILAVVVSTLTFSTPSATAASDFDAIGHGKLPIIGTPCTKSGSVVKNAVYQFTCKSDGGNAIWSGTPIQYKIPAMYLKGYVIGQALKKSNADGENSALICKNTADGYVVKNYQIQEGAVSKSTVSILSDYYGYMGCWDGYSSTSKAPATISLPDPVGPFFAQPSGQLLNITENVLNLFSEIGDVFQGGTEEGLKWLSSFQVKGAFDKVKLDSCSKNRIDTGWTIVSMTPDMRTLSYSYESDWRVFPDPASEFDSGRITSQPYSSTPLRVFVWELYHDNVNGDFGTGNWRRVVVNNDGSLSYIISQCATEDESSLGKVSSWNLETAPKQIKPPTGKVDKRSNAYKIMYTVGQNFAKVSMASDTARSQCLSAMASGIIKARGIPQYLGAQARQLQSYLSTPSGFQGCIDGFGH
jgi:hypothetical protein